MVSGCHLTINERTALVEFFLSAPEKSAQECIDELFSGPNSSSVGVDYIYRKKRWIRQNSDDIESLYEYVHGKPSSGGPKRKFSDIDDGVVQAVGTVQPKPSLNAVARIVSQITGDPVVSRQTIAESLKKSKITVKTVTTVSALLDEVNRAKTLEFLSPFTIDSMHDPDESLAAMKKFQGKRARAIFGTPAICKEWYIKDNNGRIYSVIGDYTSKGWSCWRICYGNVNHRSFEDFLNEDLSKILLEGDVVLHDGASIHMASTTLDLLDRITDGLHYKVSAFSHDLSPVEKGFANVWGYIRSHWNPTAGQSPSRLINEAFHLYSVDGARGYVAEGHWNLYKRNHEIFLDTVL
jgi:hypothetical protein